MHRRYGLLTLLSAAVVMAVVYVGVKTFQPAGMPFSVDVMNSHTAVIVPIPGIALPRALDPGDRVNLSTTPRATRIAITRFVQFNDSLPAGRTYDFVIRRGRASVRVPVTVVATGTGVGMLWSESAFASFAVLLGGIALLASWRGRDRAAVGLGLWAISLMAGLTAGSVPLDGRLGLGVQLGKDAFYLLARVGFYMMVESMVSMTLPRRSRTLWRGSFLLLLSAGAVVTLGGAFIFVATGWAEFLRPQYGFVLTASYLVPVGLLLSNYRHADGAQRLRLRWMLWSSVVFVVSVLLVNTPLLGFLTSDITNTLMFPIAMVGFLYAVLRHRVVDITVVINRALVYALTTSLVLGLFALLESLIERTTLGRSAGLLLELAVPLGLGVALSSVHRRVEALVDRFVFRRQYRAETALRRLGEDCGFIRESERLFALGVEEVARHTDAPLVALYERSPGGEGYVCRRQQGVPALQETIPIDDRAFVALRARNAELALRDTPSVLGAEGYAYPLMLRGDLLGALVVGERPGEHYAADERALLFHVAHEIGAALFALRARASEAQAQASEAMLKDARAQVQASEAMLNEVRAQARASEERARASETLLLRLLPAAGATARP
jgi:hypothetical protein